MAVDDGDGRIAPYGANGNTTQAAPRSAYLESELKEGQADPMLPDTIGGMAPAWGGDAARHGAVDADCATSASPARGNSTMGTECDPLATDRTGPASPLPTQRDTY